jgi:hypothetical protein
VAIDKDVLPIVNTTVFDVPPPGLATETLAVPADPIKFAGTDAVNCVALTNVVDSALPFHCTVDPLTNPAPLTVSVNADPPAVAAFGLRPLIVRLLMVTTDVFDIPPPGLATETLAVPADPIKFAGTDAVNCVGLTNVVDSALPFHCTVDPLTKAEPLIVRVKAGPPTVAELGESPDTEGVGGELMVSVVVTVLLKTKLYVSPGG